MHLPGRYCKINVINNKAVSELKKFPIGVILDSFRKPVLEALDITQQLGAQGIQVYATRGEMAPENLKGEKRKQFLKEVSGPVSMAKWASSLSA